MSIWSLITVAAILALMPTLWVERKDRWRPPCVFALIMWFALGNVFPYAIGEAKNYQQNYLIGIFAIPAVILLSDYISWRFTQPFYSRLWIKLKGRTR